MPQCNITAFRPLSGWQIPHREYGNSAFYLALGSGPCFGFLPTAKFLRACAGRTETEVVAVDVRTIGPNSDPQHSIHPRRNTPRALVNELPDGH